MKQFVQNGSNVWVALLPKLGVVVYDPQSQVDVPANRVRLYIRDPERMATFVKDFVRDRLAESNDEDSEQFAEPVEF